MLRLETRWFIHSMLKKFKDFYNLITQYGKFSVFFLIFNLMYQLYK